MKICQVSHLEQVSMFHQIRRQWRKQFLQGRFYAEGEQVIYRLLQSPVKLISVLITAEYLERWSELFAQKKDPDLTIWIASKKWMEENLDQRLNQPCLGIGIIPGSPPLDDLIHSDECLFVALNGIDHAVNVGAILRNCAAFRASAVFVDQTSIHPYSWRSIRASLGGVFHVPVFSEASVHEILLDFRNRGIELIAADPQGSIPLGGFEFSRRSCMIFGNEHQGISRETLNLVSRRVAIPISRKIDSLNVASASAIFLHHARKSS